MHSDIEWRLEYYQYFLIQNQTTYTLYYKNISFSEEKLNNTGKIHNQLNFHLFFFIWLLRFFEKLCYLLSSTNCKIQHIKKQMQNEDRSNLNATCICTCNFYLGGGGWCKTTSLHERFHLDLLNLCTKKNRLRVFFNKISD